MIYIYSYLNTIYIRNKIIISITKIRFILVQINSPCKIKEKPESQSGYVLLKTKLFFKSQTLEGNKISSLIEIV
jgi:hypothetical protein